MCAKNPNYEDNICPAPDGFFHSADLPGEPASRRSSAERANSSARRIDTNSSRGFEVMGQALKAKAEKS